MLPVNWYTLNEEIADIGTATVVNFVVPQDGYLRKVESVIGAAITTADDVVSVIVDGTTLSPTITITQSGSAAGDYDFAEYFAKVHKGSRIQLSNSGASTGTTKCAYTLTLSP